MIETKTDSYTYLEYRLDANSGFNSHIKINSKGGEFNINHYIKMRFQSRRHADFIISSYLPNEKKPC